MTTNPTSGMYHTSHYTFTCENFFIFREIEDEETGDLDGEVEDGTLLSEAESDDD